MTTAVNGLDHVTCRGHVVCTSLFHYYLFIFPTGFRHVTPEEYKCRLFRVTGHHSHKVRATEVPLTADSLNDGDTFILDNGLTLFQWQGKVHGLMFVAFLFLSLFSLYHFDFLGFQNCGMFEKNHAREVSTRLDSERRGKAEVIVLDQVGDGDDDHHDEAFWTLLGGKKEDHEIPAEAPDDNINVDTPTVLWRMSDSSGDVTCEEGARDMGEDGGAVHTGLLDENDVFYLWSPRAQVFFVWVGNKASDNERRMAMFRAEKALRSHGLNPATPITRVRQGYEPASFMNAID